MRGAAQVRSRRAKGGHKHTGGERERDGERRSLRPGGRATERERLRNPQRLGERNWGGKERQRQRLEERAENQTRQRQLGRLFSSEERGEVTPGLQRLCLPSPVLMQEP